MTRIDRLLNIAEYKRRQAAPGVKVTREEFRPRPPLSITNRFRDTGKPLPEPDETLVSRAGKRLGGSVRRISVYISLEKASVARRSCVNDRHVPA